MDEVFTSGPQRRPAMATARPWPEPAAGTPTHPWPVALFLVSLTALALGSWWGWSGVVGRSVPRGQITGQWFAAASGPGPETAGVDVFRFVSPVDSGVDMLWVGRQPVRGVSVPGSGAHDAPGAGAWLLLEFDPSAGLGYERYAVGLLEAGAALAMQKDPSTIRGLWQQTSVAGRLLEVTDHLAEVPGSPGLATLQVMLDAGGYRIFREDSPVMAGPGSMPREGGWLPFVLMSRDPRVGADAGPDRLRRLRIGRGGVVSWPSREMAE